MIWSDCLGLPMSLDAVATVLNPNVQKDSAGRKLIKQFCTPTTPSVLNGGKHRNPPSADPTGWARFIDYNHRDVEVELAIHERLSSFPMPDAERETYALDQRINDAGIILDHTLVGNAVAVDEHHRNASLARVQKLTELDNPNSPIQLKQWLHNRGCELKSLAKADVNAALDTATGVVREVLELRGDLAKSSVKKYQAMQNIAGPMAVRAGSSNSTEQAEADASQDASSKSKTCQGIICLISIKHARSSEQATSTHLSCSTIPCPALSRS